MAKLFVIPEDPVARFTELYKAVTADRRWFTDVTALRFAALTLATAEGEPHQVAAELKAVADELKATAGWFGSMNSTIRFIVAAILLRNGDGAAAFTAEVERVQELFRVNGLRRGAIYEVMAILVMRQADPDGAIVQSRIARFKEIYEMMKSYHGWLTNADDYPACALLMGRDEPVEEIGVRIETFYNGLAGRKYAKGNALQMVSHILYFNPRHDEKVLERFDRLYLGFKEKGLWMNAGDYDEMAILTFIDHPPEKIIEVVTEHRRHMDALEPRPDKNMTFSLACSTAFLELVRLDEDLEVITDAKALATMQAIIAAQQAAAAAAASSVAVTSAVT